MNKRNIFAIILSVLIICGALFFNEKKTSAQAGVMNLIGGKITYIKYCCNGLILTVSGSNSGNFFISWADIANPKVNYLYKNVYVGMSQNTVGQAFRVAFCVDIEAECEDADPVQGGTILLIGTSLRQ
ncbi:MAG: hypothetical protein ABI430_03375 [Candidatus Taylorbacteria bacterium]